MKFKKQAVRLSIDRIGRSDPAHMDVQAFVSGDWAIHHPVGCLKAWHVSHVPTGCSVGVWFDKLHHAKRFVERIAELQLPPLGVGFGCDASGYWDWNTRRRTKARIQRLKQDCERQPETEPST